ncbi:cell division cycle-associated protein 4 [Salarias fasciatus]|uniref:cell division cycle-associated protein 4 n=1 Tax=Salarias fasciatus TaxID=181472 RepID=UPI0011768629|nr:cell division cycle-associated protein 4 [Salarias fasciatus]XP_029972663.1 cell division cycle-associated protein 4 [Salarias fasciatus]XP_029972664.1 cell division cycle-associated protein 4 [Salarias fasciatus]XP_029972665.1 cell division cycle-associated protein 4 [Salarias fasciatus]XP_029972666.1 cell division cycle-associated protein 4 [Salarias fasciatus]XP_029972667.1 cell division cycle-associated protein 4 [Salarias fasciatus]
MFPKGTKRKFSDSGEEPAPGGDQSPAAATAAAAAARTLSSSYSLQRQSLLDMSLIKLQLCHMLVEPNLCRSVLIANTVRQIQEEMTQDGTWQIMTQALAAAQCPADRLVATEVLCRQTDAAAAAQAGQSPKPFAVVGLEDGYHSEEVVMEGDVEAEVTMSTLSPVSPQLPSASYLAGPFGMGPCWEEEDDDGDCEEDEEDDSEECVSEGEEADRDSRTGEQVFGTFEIKHPAPPPDPALEELFSDVDPSYYDLDTVLTGMQSTPKMGPYDLLDSLSPHGPSALSPGASCRADLNELDHIMEIIVGS